METVTIKTCCDLQTFAWVDGALVSLADLINAQRGEMAVRSERLKILHTIFPGANELMGMLREMIAYKWMYQHSPSPPYRGPSLQE